MVDTVWRIKVFIEHFTSELAMRFFRMVDHKSLVANSIWRDSACYAAVLLQTRYLGVFGILDYESLTGFRKFNMD